MTATDPAAPPPTSTRRRSRARRRRSSSLEKLDLAGVAVGAAAAALIGTSGGATAFRAVDLVLAAAVAALVTVAASRAHRWTVIWLAGIAAIGAVGSPWLAAAALALALGAVVASARKRSRLLDAVIAALAVQAVLRFGDFAVQGLPALVALVAVTPVLVSGYRESPSPVRRVVRLAALGGAGFVFVATAAAGGAGLAAKGSFDAGVVAATDGLDALGTGEQQAAAGHFDAAAERFDQAGSLAGGPWMWPSWLVPGVAPQSQALAALADSGAAVATAAADTARVAPYTEVGLTGGTVDVTRLAAMADPARNQAAVVQKAQDDLGAARSPWLLAAVADPLERFAAGLADARPSVDLAADLTRVTPRMLGSDGVRRYLVVVADPAEARFSGGTLEAFGELTASGGRVTLTRWGGIDELAAPATDAVAPGDRTFTDRYGRYQPGLRPENLAASPDFPTDMRVLADRYAQVEGGNPVDGVMLVDPVGLAALLTLTGPIGVAGAPGPLTAENAAAFLLSGQYVAGQAADASLLGPAGSATAEALMRGLIPGGAAVGRALADAAAAGHIQVAFSDPEVQDVFGSLAVSHRFPVADQADHFSVRTANDAGNKVDSYLTRTTDYTAVVDPATGAVDATATVTLTNSVPTDLLATGAANGDDGQPPGTSSLYVSFYTPLLLSRADLDGRPAAFEPQREFTGNVYSTKITIAPGASAVVRLQLAGTVGAVPTYRLMLSSQPALLPDRTTVTVTGAPGWTIGGRESVERQVAVAGSTEVRVDLERR